MPSLKYPCFGIFRRAFRPKQTTAKVDAQVTSQKVNPYLDLSPPSLSSLCSKKEDTENKG